MRSKIYIGLLLLAAAACSSEHKHEATTTRIIPMSSPAGANSGEPFLFTDGDTTVYLSWIEKVDTIATFKFSTLNGRQWSEPVSIAGGGDWFVNWADYPMIAAQGQNMVAHFLRKSSKSTYAYDVRLTTSSDAGKTWMSPIILHDDKKEAEHGFVTLLPYGDNFFVTWLDGRNAAMEGMEGMDHHGGHHGAMSLRAAIIDRKGNKINEWELDNKTCDCCQTSAAITSNGPVVIYRDRSDEEIRDMSIVRLIDGQWTEPKSIHNDNWKIAGCPVNGPRVVANGNNLAAAWFSAASDTAHVNVVFSSDGGATFGKAVRIDEGHAIGRVDIVMIDERTAAVSWMEGSEIKLAKIFSDGTKESSMSIGSTSESRSSGFPQMTLKGNQLLFAWTDDKEKTIKVASASVVASTESDVRIIAEQAQPDTLKGSVKAKAMGTIGNTGVAINYYSPAVRGRVIWGGLVPFDNVWVTGAHRATTIEFDQEVEIGGTVVAPGKYGLFTIPGKEGWTIIINKNWDQHLADNYDKKDDIVRVVVKPETETANQERLRYVIESDDNTTGEIVVYWERLEVSLPVKTKS